jgi:hypothetical protein
MATIPLTSVAVAGLGGQKICGRDPPCACQHDAWLALRRIGGGTGQPQHEIGVNIKS